MKAVYVLVEVTDADQFIGVIAIAQTQQLLRDIIKSQKLEGNWNSSFLEFQAIGGNTFFIQSRYLF